MHLLLLLAILSIPVAAEPAGVRQALDKAVSVVQTTQNAWFKTQACTSCHHTVLTGLALMEARSHGVRIDEAGARQHFTQAFKYLTDIDLAAQGYDTTDSALNDTYTMLAAHAAGLGRNAAAAARIRMVASRQTPEGRWRTLDMRPPQTGSPFTTTALTLRAMQLYMPQTLSKETTERVRRAAKWLETNQPRTTEDRAYQLLGLGWADADPAVRRRAAQQLVAEQRNDGGWAQIPRRASDAYSTGQALYALHTAGTIPVTHAAYHRGLEFLLKTQKPDGSWHVISRIHDNAPVSPPFFESGFPHGKDQFTSLSGTSWAIRALALTLPQAGAAPFTVDLPLPTTSSWISTALFGTRDDLAKSLASGLDPNSATPAGTTALMLAAGDPAKVRLLLDRGADVNAISKSKHTALLAATAYGSNAATVELLINKGARINPASDSKPLFNTSPLTQAVIAGDHATLKLLLAKGADINQRSIAFGAFTVWPLIMAVLYSDQTAIGELVARGAKLDDVDQDGSSFMTIAALSGYTPIVRQLAKLGVNANHPGKDGMTPLLWASTMEHESADVVAALLEAGADPRAASKSGLTPLMQARKYGNKDAEALLLKAGANK